MKDNVRLLSTRPLDEALIERAAQHNIVLHVQPFISIQKLTSGKLVQQIAALALQPPTVVFTSVNAVEVVIDLLPKRAVMPPWRIYCTGGATFTLLKKFWSFDAIAFTAKNASGIANRIADDGVKAVTFFCGSKRREELPSLLREREIAVNELVVYETLETPVKIDEAYDGILFFSPSAVNSFFSCNGVGGSTILFAIGNTTASAIRQFSNNTIIVSDFPAKDQLVGKAIEYFK